MKEIVRRGPADPVDPGVGPGADGRAALAANLVGTKGDDVLAGDAISSRAGNDNLLMGASGTTGSAAGPATTTS